MKDQYAKTMITLLSILVLILFIWGIRETQIVSIPVFFSLFMVVLLRPLDYWLKSRLALRLRWVSLIITFLVGAAAFGIITGAIWININLLSSQLPKYQTQLIAIWEIMVNKIADFGILLPTKAFGSQGFVNRFLDIFSAGVTSLGSLITMIVISIFLILLMLIEADEWKSKLLAIIPQKHINEVMVAIQDISLKVRQFLFVRTLISSITGLTIGLWLWALDIEFAFMWGLLSFFLNYIPNIGSIIAVIPPSIVALLQYNLGWATLTIAGLTVIQQVIGNYIDPRFQGKVLSISPMILLVALIFWSWVWGVAGALLAVPLTVTIVISMFHIKPLKPLAVLLSSQPGAGLFKKRKKSTH